MLRIAAGRQRTLAQLRNSSKNFFFARRVVTLLAIGVLELSDLVGQLRPLVHQRDQVAIDAIDFDTQCGNSRCADCSLWLFFSWLPLRHCDHPDGGPFGATSNRHYVICHLVLAANRGVKQRGGPRWTSDAPAAYPTNYANLAARSLDKAVARRP